MAISFGYQGGKNNLAPKIIPLLPNTKAYCEPFFGSGAVYFNKPRSQINVLNDSDSRIVNFFKVLRDSPDELLRRIELTPHHRGEHQICTAQDSTDPIERARQTFVTINQSVFKSTNPNGVYRFSKSIGRDIALSTGGFAKMPSSIHLAQRLTQIVESLQDAEFECQCGIKVLEDRVDYSGWLIYIDPPYLNTLSPYQDTFTESHHKRLLTAVQGARAKIAISGYQNDSYSTELENWGCIKFEVPERASVKSVGTRRGTKQECLWVNYEITGSLL